MAVRITRNAGMLLLAIWLILEGLTVIIALPLPPAVMAALALIAGNTDSDWDVVRQSASRSEWRQSHESQVAHHLPLHLIPVHSDQSG